MADEIDIAQEKNELLLSNAIAAARRAVDALPSTGLCHNCGEEVSDNRHFCDADCRDDWQKRRHAKTREGRGVV